MESFEESAPGRLLTLAVALPLAVGASTTLHGERLDALIITGALFGGIVLATLGVFIALEERPKYAITAIIALPPTLLFYFPLLAVAGHWAVVRVAMGLVAGALVGFLAKGFLPRTRTRLVVLHARRMAQH